MVYTRIKQAYDCILSNHAGLKGISDHLASIPKLIIYLFSLHTPRNDLANLSSGRGIRVSWQ